jgi:hypothetical protein
MNGEPTNSERADWAEKALKTFAECTRVDDEDAQTQVQDLLADLFHLCDRHEVDIASALRMGICHYECEREEEDGKPCRVDYERAPWMEDAKGG